MSRTIVHNKNIPWYKGKPHRANNLGICMCQQCKRGRRGTKDSSVIKLKRKIRRWFSNKPEEYGAYTD